MAATQETDLAIRIREWNKGHEAFKAGLNEDACPWISGLVYRWWLDGFYGRNYPASVTQHSGHAPC